MAVDLARMPREEQALLGVGLLAFIATFFPFDGIHIGGFGANESAWHGTAGVLGSLAITLAVVTVAVALFAAANAPQMPVSLNFIAAGLGVLAALLFIIHWIALPSSDAGGVHIGLSLQWGGYVEVILSIAFAALAALRLRSSGEAMPWADRGVATPPPPPPAV